MRKAIKTSVLLSLPLLVACGGSSSKEPVNEAPTKVELISPVQNKLCIHNNVSFDWSDATDVNNDAIKYKVEFSTTRDMASIIKTQTVTLSKAQIILDKNVAYYWRVTPIDAKGLAGEASSVYAFYTKGTGVVNAVPFTAKLVSPADGGDPLAASTVSVDLKWDGTDSDNDANTLKYDLYFGETTDPAIKEENLTVLTKNVTVESGKTYYWKVNTIDPTGAKSIGQVWSFKVD